MAADGGVTCLSLGAAARSVENQLLPQVTFSLASVVDRVLPFPGTVITVANMLSVLESQAVEAAGPEEEKFAGSAGRWLGWTGVAIGAAMVFLDWMTGEWSGPTVPLIGVAIACFCWVTLVRPQASAHKNGLLLQNMLRDVAIPWQLIEGCQVGQTLVVTTKEAERFFGLGVTRSARSQMREEYGTTSIIFGGRGAPAGGCRRRPALRWRPVSGRAAPTPGTSSRGSPDSPLGVSAVATRRPADTLWSHGRRCLSWCWVSAPSRCSPASCRDRRLMSRHVAHVRWSRGDQPFTYDEYCRDHVWSFDSGITVAASASPVYLGGEHAVDPEEAFVASVSSCHMLTFLAIAARNGW